MTTEDIARLALKSDFGSVTRTIPCGYRCTCSRERTEQILLSLGRKELERLAAEEDTVEVKCHFCDAVYRISAAELLKQVDAER
jgi:molecular chaperone Hsp33